MGTDFRPPVVFFLPGSGGGAAAALRLYTGQEIPLEEIRALLYT